MERLPHRREATLEISQPQGGWSFQPSIYVLKGRWMNLFSIVPSGQKLSFHDDPATP